MKLTRRDVLRLAGGSVVGAMFTPVPWKLLDDSSIWTQNWSLVPPLPRGPMSTRYSHCNLCPAGCSLKAHCVNGIPVRLAGVPNGVLKNGTLCAVGLAGHHVAYHPLRLSGPHTFTGKADGSFLLPVTIDTLVANLVPKYRRAMSSSSAGVVAVLDQRPGRAMSRRYQEFLSAFPGSMYIVPPSGEDGMLRTMQGLSTEPCASLGFDFEHSRTILSIGAPLLDGWGVPERMQALFADQTSSGRTLIQVESSQSRTARAAAIWLPVVPGAEAALVLSLANVIVREGLYPKEVERTIIDFSRYRDLVLRYHPHPVSSLAGVSPGAIVETARAIASSPSIVIAGADPAGGPMAQATEILVAGLNLLLGNPGRKGGIVYRRETPDASASGVPEIALHQIPDHSIELLIMDGAEAGQTFPSSLLKRKMVRDGGTVVLLSPHLSPRSASADYLVSTPAPFESWDETPASPGSPVASFGVSMPLMAPRTSSVEAISFLSLLSSAIGHVSEGAGSLEQLLRRKADAITAAGRGMAYPPDGSGGTPVSSFADAEALWEILKEGGNWVDEPAPPAKRGQFKILGSLTDDTLTSAAHLHQPEGGSITLTPFGVRAALASGAVSPILSKIFQESDLRNSGGTVLINPATASQFGLLDGDRAAIRTRNGSMRVRVLLDPAVRPNMLHAAVGPLPNGTPDADELTGEGVLALCVVQNDGTWRFTDVTIEKA